MLGDQVFEEDLDGMAEDDRVGDLHHRRLHVEREEDTVGLGLGNLLAEEGHERLLAHHGAVEDLPGLQRSLFLEGLGHAILSDKLDLHVGRRRNGHRLLVGEEVVLTHGADTGLRISAPGTHGVRMLAGIFLDRLGGTAIGISLTEDGIDRTALDLVIAGANLLVGVVLGIIGIIRELVSLGLELGDRGLELRYGGADVGEFDDICLRLEGQGAKLCQRVADPLILGQELGEIRNNTACERDISEFHRDSGVLRKSLDDWQEGIGGERGSLVGGGIEDGRLGHDCGEITGNGVPLQSEKVAATSTFPPTPFTLDWTNYGQNAS